MLFLPYNKRKILTWFRTSSQKLPIVKGRHLGVDMSKRKSPLCESDSIGDKSHYVDALPYFCHTREKYLGKPYYNENEIQLHNMLNNESKLKNMSRLIDEITKVFEKL